MYMKKSFLVKTVSLIACCFAASCGTQKQSVKASSNTSIGSSFEIITDLDLEITETSGLEAYNEQLITHNDSDAGPVIYFLNTDGAITSQVEFLHMKNIDWEDITRSDEHLFIADTGNNYGNRKDLTIYKIPLTDLENAQARPQIIELEYDAQKVFEKKNQNHSFDGEAIVYVKDRLLLFSKDWSSFQTQVYELEQKSDKQKLISKQSIPVNGLVTGATFNGDSRVVLCGYNSSLDPFVAILSTKGSNFELIERIDLPIVNGAQIEAITFYQTINNKEIYYLTSEAVNIKLGEDEAKTNGQLYKMTLSIE